MSSMQRLKPILPQAESTNPEKNLRFYSRLDRENNILPLENWDECFKNRPASAPSQIIPGLYLSNIKTAAHFLLGNESEEFPITHVLSIIQTSGTVRWKLPEAQGAGKSIKRLILDRRDKKNENILRDFDRTSAFIHEAVQQHKISKGKSGGVLVHCFAGISRSASLVIAYLLKNPENIPPAARIMMDEVVRGTANFVKSRRDIINPNIGFQDQIGFYHDVLKCSLRDEQTKQMKRPYRRWIQQRACNNSRKVVSIILELAAAREKIEEPSVKADFTK